MIVTENLQIKNMVKNHHLAKSILDVDIPLVMVQLGSFVANPFQTFVISLLLAGLFWGLGRLLWKITVAYVKAVSHEKEKFNI